MTDELDLGAPKRVAPSHIPADLEPTQSEQTAAGPGSLRRQVYFGLLVLVILAIAFVWSQTGSKTTSKNQTAAVTVLDPTTAPQQASVLSTLPEHSPNHFAPYEITTQSGRSLDDGAAIDALMGRKQIALVIDDLGLSKERTKAVADLGVPLTMSFLPYASNLQGQVAYAHRKEHDVFAHIPMEPMDPNANAGENVLKLEMSEADLKQTLAINLAPFVHLDGVNNHMGSRFTSDRDSMVWFMGEMRSRGLLFLDSRTTTETQGEQAAIASGMPGLRRHVFLDHERPSDPQKVISQLLVLEDEARKRGIAVAIGHPHPATLEALRQWIPNAKSQGLLFVRMRDVAAQYEHQRSGEFAATRDATDNVALTP